MRKDSVILGLVVMAGILAAIAGGVLVYQTSNPFLRVPKKPAVVLSPTPNMDTVYRETVNPEGSSSAILSVEKKIISIGSQEMVVSDGLGDMTLSTDQTITQVVKRQGEKLLPVQISDLKVGINVTVEIVIPGKKVLVIVE